MMRQPSIPPRRRLATNTSAPHRSSDTSGSAVTGTGLALAITGFRDAGKRHVQAIYGRRSVGSGMAITGGDMAVVGIGRVTSGRFRALYRGIIIRGTNQEGGLHRQTPLGLSAPSVQSAHLFQISGHLHPCLSRTRSNLIAAAVEKRGFRGGASIGITWEWTGSRVRESRSFVQAGDLNPFLHPVPDPESSG